MGENPLGRRANGPRLGRGGSATAATPAQSPAAEARTRALRTACSRSQLARIGTIVALKAGMRHALSVPVGSRALTALAIAAVAAFGGHPAAASELRASAANVAGIVV